VASEQPSDGAIQKALSWITEAGINGFGVMPSAQKVADDHYKSTQDVEKAIDSIIKWRTGHAAATGFVSGVGGIAALPVAIPASLLTSYALAANTAAAIACLRGFDVHSEQVKTMILLCLVGEGAEEILKATGIAFGTKLSQALIQKIPGQVLIEINKRIGFRLLTKAGEKGVVNLTKMVPIAGGVVGAGFDSMFVNRCGVFAKKALS